MVVGSHPKDGFYSRWRAKSCHIFLHLANPPFELRNYLSRLSAKSVSCTLGVNLSAWESLMDVSSTTFRCHTDELPSEAECLCQFGKVPGMCHGPLCNEIQRYYLSRLNAKSGQNLHHFRNQPVNVGLSHGCVSDHFLMRTVCHWPNAIFNHASYTGNIPYVSLVLSVIPGQRPYALTG